MSALKCYRLFDLATGDSPTPKLALMTSADAEIVNLGDRYYATEVYSQAIQHQAREEN